MGQGSTHLEGIITFRDGTTELEMVFVDIEKYSQRRTYRQRQVLDVFATCVNSAIGAVGDRYEDRLRRSRFDLSTDLIVLPTGDGIGVGFTFGIPRMGLDFALALLEAIHEHNNPEEADAGCKVFDEKGWCNCHSYFNVRIGIARGDAVVFRDVTGHYNAAGTVVNEAARIMDRMARATIGMSTGAKERLLDFEDDPDLERRFIDPAYVVIKFNQTLPIHQYVDPDVSSLDSTPVAFAAPPVLDAMDNGLIAVDLKQESDEVYDRLASAREIKLFYNTARGVMRRHQEALAEAILEHGCHVKLLISDTRDRAIFQDAEFTGALCPNTNIGEEVEGTLGAVQDVLNRVREVMDLRDVDADVGSFEVRFFRGVPTSSMAIVDDEVMRYSPYLPYSNAERHPAYLLRNGGKGGLYARLRRVFDDSWDKARHHACEDFAGEPVDVTAPEVGKAAS